MINTNKNLLVTQIRTEFIQRKLLDQFMMHWQAKL